LFSSFFGLQEGIDQARLETRSRNARHKMCYLRHL
jgi:hypothetical protein